MNLLRHFFAAFLLFLGLFVPTSGLIAQQSILLAENFNACTLPAGWTTNTTQHWTIAALQGNFTLDNTCMMTMQDVPTGNALSLQFTSPTFNARQDSTVTFSIDLHLRTPSVSVGSTSGAALKLFVWDGTKYVSLAYYRYSDFQNTDKFTFTADLTFYRNAAMKIKIQFEEGATRGASAAFDNVKVTGTKKATNILLENFDACAKPTGWTTQVLKGSSDWSFGTLQNGNYKNYAASLNGTCLAFFDDDILGETAAPSKVRLTSPAFNGTRFGDLWLDFDLNFKKYAALENVTIYVTDGVHENVVETILSETSADQQLFKYSHLRYNISLFKSTQMRLIFEYDDGANWDWWVGIDNVKVSGEGTLNDFCTNATVLTAGAPCAAGSNANAVFQGSQPACSPQNVGSLWYQFSPTVSGSYAFKTNSNFNESVSVYTGTCAATLDLLCHNKDEHGFTGENLYFQATAGTNYLIRVSGQDKDFGKSRGNVCVQILASPPPPTPANDLCAAALPLVINQNCAASSTNIDATYSTPLPTKNLRARADVWYKFTTNSTKDLEITTNADFAEVITAYKGSCAAPTEFASNDYGRTLKLTGNTVGTTFYVQISGYFASVEGSFCPTVKEIAVPAAIPNEVCSNAVAVPVAGTCVSGSNKNATMSAVKPSCSIFNDADIWFKFVAPASGSVKINTGADFVHTLAVYRGTCTVAGGLSGLIEILCKKNPLRCEGWQILGGLTPNATYFLQISSQKTSFGYEYGNVCIKITDGNIDDNIRPLRLAAKVNCTTSGQGQLALEATGGTGNYTFVGTPNGATLNTRDRFTAIVKDENGCEQAISDTCACGVLLCTLSANVTATATSCNGTNDGKATAIAANANNGATYQWSNGSTAALLTGLTPGSYSVTITDGSGCVSSSSVIVQQPLELLAYASTTNETYYQGNDGKLSASPTGGTPPYAYLWETGSTSQTVTGISPNTYQLTVTDAKGCISKQTVTVGAFNCTLATTAVANHVTCFGQANGAAITTPSAGYVPYSYAWSNGTVGTNALNNLLAGTYRVTITDNKNCPSVQSIVVLQPNILQTTTATMGETIIGANNGIATATPSGGTPPYNYLWSNGGNTQTLTNLAPGAYQVSVIDANNCVTFSSANVNTLVCNVQGASSGTDVSCFGRSDGTATATMPNGIPPFTYAWSNGTNQSTATNLPAGVYSATITDSRNCAVTSGVIIGQPAAFTATIGNTSPVVCTNDANGTATVSVAGGTPPYNYSWQNGNNTPTASNLGVGTFSVVATDSRQCVATTQATVDAFDNVAPVVLVKNIVIFLDATGNASVAASQINNGSSDNCAIANIWLNKTQFDCANVGQNTVELSVVDASGNAANASAIVNVIDNTAPIFSCPANIVSPNCDRIVAFNSPTASDNCSTTLAATQTSGLASGAKFPVGTTIITFVATDASNNTSVCSFSVTQKDTLHASFLVEKPSCFGEANGYIAATPVGGSHNYQFAWSNGETTSSINNLAAGIYTATLTDELNCTYSQQILVTEPSPIVIQLDGISDETPSSKGNISVTPTGGTPPYGFTWTKMGSTFQSNAEDLQNLDGGTYRLQITDANGCNIFSENYVIKNLTATDEIGADDTHIRLQPNPTDGKTMLFVEEQSGSNLRLTLFDAAMRQLFDRQQALQPSYELDLSAMAAGVYWLKIELAEQTAWRKIVVVR